MRLIDRLAVSGSIIDGEVFEQHEGNRLLDVAMNCPVFVVDNVADYVMHLADWNSRELASAVPIAVPPFERCFIEAKEPLTHWCANHRSVEQGDYPAGTVFGSLLITYDLFELYEKDGGEHDEEKAIISASVWARIQLARMARDATNPDLDLDGIDRITTPIRWGVHAFHYFWVPGQTIVPLGPVATEWWFLKPDGSFGETAGGFAALFRRGLHRDIERAHEILVGWHGRSLSVLMSIAFTHCKNVAVDEVDGRYENRQQRRDAERRKSPPLSRYYTLEIESMTKRLADARSTGGDTKRALHICRGHFSEYSEEKPLFGKYAGRFWIPAHIRGTAEAGKIIKDYSVKAPKESSA